MSQSESSTDSTITVPTNIEGMSIGFEEETDEETEHHSLHERQVAAVLVPLDDYQDLLHSLVDAKDALDATLGKLLQYHTQIAEE